MAALAARGQTRPFASASVRANSMSLSGSPNRKVSPDVTVTTCKGASGLSALRVCCAA